MKIIENDDCDYCQNRPDNEIIKQFLKQYAIIYGADKFYSLDSEDSLESVCSEWRNHPNERVAISEVLVNKKEMIGIDKDKVFELLGEPSKEIEEDSYIIYSCRKEGVLSGYTLFLNIEFDQNDKVNNLHTFIIDD